MTRKKTFIVGLIAALAYMLGFIPLLWSNVNNLKSVGYSAAVAGVAIGAFLVCGFIYLIFLRKRRIRVLLVGKY
jgi:predicted RND superfamily exporter protein